MDEKPGRLSSFHMSASAMVPFLMSTQSLQKSQERERQKCLFSVCFLPRYYYYLSPLFSDDDDSMTRMRMHYVFFFTLPIIIHVVCTTCPFWLDIRSKCHLKCQMVINRRQAKFTQKIIYTRTLFSKYSSIPLFRLPSSTYEAYWSEKRKPSQKINFNDDCLHNCASCYHYQYYQSM